VRKGWQSGPPFAWIIAADKIAPSKKRRRRQRAAIRKASIAVAPRDDSSRSRGAYVDTRVANQPMRRQIVSIDRVDT